MSRTFFENVSILTCDRDNRFIRHGQLVVENGRFEQIKDLDLNNGNAQDDQVQSASERIDLAGYVVIPGLVNTHTHLWLGLLRGLSDDLPLFPWIRKLTRHIGEMDAKDLLLATYIGIVESLKSGTTCICECCRYHPALAAQVASELGSRLVVGGLPPNQLFGAPFPHDYQELVTSTRETAEQYGHEQSLVSFWLGAHSPYNCSSAFLKEAKSEATAHNYDFYIHLAETRDEVNFVAERYGKTPVQYAADLGILDSNTVCIHCVWLTDEDVRLIEQSGARIAHCPVSNAKLASGVAPVPKYRQVGIPVGLGTDSMVSNNTLSMFQEMRFAVLLQRALHQDATVLNAEDALRMATLDSARVLGLEREIGSIEVGKLADFVVLQLRHPYQLMKDTAVSEVIYASHRDDISMVYVHGKKIVENGQLTTVDEEELWANIRERYHHLPPFVFEPIRQSV